MSSQDFANLQTLIAKLNSVSQETAQKNRNFGRYHRSSLTLLEAIPQHLTSLYQGIAAADALSSDATKRS